MMWRPVPIGSVCEPTAQRDPRQTPDEVFQYIDISSIDRASKAITSTPSILGAEAPSRARKEVRDGDVLVSTVRPNLNAIAQVHEYLDGQIASTGFCVLRPKSDILLSRYLFYYAQTSGFIDSLMAVIRGAHYPAVSDGDVRGAMIPLPGISEQRRIVEILDQADELRKLRAKADVKAERILPALFIKMFGDPATNPREWPEGHLGDVISETQYGTSTRANTSETGVVVLRMNNITRSGQLDLRSLKHVVLKDKEVERYLLQPGDLLFNRTNSADLVGKTGLWEEQGFDAVPASYLIRVRVDRSQAFPEFIWAFMNTGFIKQILFNKARRAIGMSNINAKELRKLPLLLPPRHLQATFVEGIVGAAETGRAQTRSTAKLESLFSVLLHRAFTGDLTASWREAHMAELLEEMEQQSRAFANAEAAG